ncbi:MAG: UDP-N-acetylmuramoyl-tripeptide--D-alanyl-D-alanine ligase [Pseudodesulfovibrio sp.]|nr:UDP-N-acetylmuramoyl-tripeptide--D-alanyl-D-alanine ligase [Pseudodesulfovibrio sp.]
MNLTLADVERCLSSMAEEGHQHISIRTVQTDSRTVEKGDLFFCIEGDNFDGHEFAQQASKTGAAGIVASRMLENIDVPVIMVRDTTEALGRVAACWRDMCGAKLIAVTGTAGKTTVKEMLYAVVSQKFSVAKNYRNFNNQIGLPMSMLKATADQQLWIMELGISMQGDMEDLAPIASPNLAVITNIGPGHLEGLGNEAGVAQAKTTLLKYLRQNGSAIVCKDYPLLWDAACEIVDQPIGFSTKENNIPHVASFLGAEADGWGLFRLRTPEGEGEFKAPFCGEHYAENLACVSATAHQLGLTRDDVIRGVQSIQADSQRFCCATTRDTLIIDDTYNANPLSMARSIKTAVDMAKDRPLVLILGDMRELGTEAKMHHVELGQLIGELAPKAVFFKGDHFNDVLSGLEGNNRNITKVNKSEEFIEAWRELELERAVVLVKGSRSCKMEDFANALRRELGNTAGAQGGTA